VDAERDGRLGVTVVISRGGLRQVGKKEFPLGPGFSTYQSGSSGFIPLLRGDQLGASYEAIYRSQPFVFAVVNKLVYGVARNKLMVQQRTEDGSMARVPGTSLEQLFRMPFPRGSEFDLKAHLALSTQVHGHALFLKYRPAPGAAPTELWPIPWRAVQTISDDRGITLYAIQLSGETHAVGPEDVLHISLPGGAPLEPLRRTVALEDAAATWQGESLRNGVTPRGAFISDQKIHESSLPRVRAELEKLYSGPDNAGRIAIMDGGVKWQQIGLSAADAQLIDQRRFSREEICAAFDVPPPLVGIAGAGGGFSAYTNVAEYRRALYDAIAARLSLYEDSISAQLIQAEPEWAGLQVVFDTTELLRPDPEARARMHLMTQQASTSTINERRAIEGYARIDDPIADAVFVPVNMLPVGADLPTPTTGTDDAGTPAQGLADQITALALAGDPEERMQK
jgi:HK97 family phage portal protein